MRVKNIKITNYKGILNSEIEFNENLNVFIGSNGAGKTTLLEAIAIGLSKLIKLFENTPPPTYLKANKVNYFEKYAEVILTINDRGNKDIVLSDSVGISSSKNKRDISDEPKLNEFAERILEDLLKFKKPLPILKFYSSNRGNNSYFDYSEDRIYRTRQFESWVNFFHDDISYSKFFKWFLEQETYELRMQRDAQNFNIQNPKIQYVRRTIAKAFEILEGKEYIVRSDTIKRAGNNNLIPVLSLQDVETDVKEIIDNKSDGEKAIISLIADIAYNLSIANQPDFSKQNFDFTEAPGIVLIDEIEAHLHPNWQRKIIPLLTKIFPYIQFFITTHSPQVAASVSSESIFVCEDFQFSKINIKSKGLDTNSLLKFIFNSTERPKEYIDLLEKFDDLIEKHASISKIKTVIEKIADLEKRDNGTDVSQLLSELELRLEAYKFDLEHEINS